MGAVSQSLPGLGGGGGASEGALAAVDLAAQELLQEVWEVVDSNYLDARQVRV